MYIYPTFLLQDTTKATILVKEQFLEYIRLEKRYSSHTCRAYSTDLEMFYNFISQEFQVSEIGQVEHGMIRSWLARESQRKISSRSIQRKISVLRSYFKFLINEKIVVNNPMEKIVAPRVSRRLPYFIDSVKMDTLLDETDFGSGFRGIRNRLIIQLLYTTGIRLSELQSLTVENIDFRAGTIRVSGKRNKERIIPLTPEMVKGLDAYILVREKQYGTGGSLFLSDSGKPMYPKAVYLIVKKYLGTITTHSRRSPHTLRHTFATQLLNNGADLNAVKELLGHASLAATQVYTHNTIEKLKNIYNQAHPKA